MTRIRDTPEPAADPVGMLSPLHIITLSLQSEFTLELIFKLMVNVLRLSKGNMVTKRLCMELVVTLL
jgi:hypothetical protein